MDKHMVIKTNVCTICEHEETCGYRSDVEKYLETVCVNDIPACLNHIIECRFFELNRLLEGE